MFWKTKKEKGSFLDEFKRDGLKTKDIHSRVCEIYSDPVQVREFAIDFLTHISKNSTVFADSLSYLKKEDLQELLNLSLEILRKGKSESAETVIKKISYQYPDLLHPHLEEIFRLNPNNKSYYTNYPWRDLPKEQISVFKDILIHPDTPKEDRIKVFNCLLETRDPESIQFAYQYALDHNILESSDPERLLEYYLEDVSFVKEKEDFRTYCPHKAYHIIFQKDYFLDDHPVWLQKRHPSWNLSTTENIYKFGGSLPEEINKPSNHLITFDEIPEGIHITGLNKLVLGVDFKLVNLEGKAFYKHAPDGLPVLISEDNDPDDVLFESISETTIRLAPTPSRWFYQSWAGSNGRENLFRIGGEPTWIQGADVLCCPCCNRKMDFLMQLDTGLPTEEKDEIYFGSGGICYTFWCDTCKVSGYMMQCT